MKKIKILLSLLFIIFLIGGCAKKEDIDKNSITSEEIIIEREDNDLVIWSHYEINDDIINGFKGKYPEINVKVRVFPFKDYQKYYLAALSAEEVPDIMIMDSTNFGSFNTLDVFEDLSSEPYDANRYKEDFDKEMWEVGSSFDRKSLIGLPIASAPIVTYYRRDIMEEYGLPSEPEDLATYMENPENWIEIGLKFKEDGRYLCQWAADPVTIVNSSIGYFDSNLNYLKDTELFSESINIAKKSRELGLVAYKDIWTEEGEEYIREGKFPMLYLGSWGADQIKEWVPEQSGKWRVTRLPFNVYGWNNSTLMSIPNKAVKKKEAWAFTEYYTFEKKQYDTIGNVTAYIPFRNNKELIEHTNEYLGGQKDQELYELVLSKTQEYPVTSLDAKAYDIWVSKVNQGLQQKYDTKTIIENINKEIEESLKTDKKILLDSIKGNRN